MPPTFFYGKYILLYGVLKIAIEDKSGPSGESMLINTLVSKDD